MLEERKLDYFKHYLMTYEMMKISFLIISVCHVLLLMYYMKNSSVPKLQRENTQFRNCIQPVEMLSITLRLVIN